MNRTPLRYPGGKSLMTNFFIDLFQANKLGHVEYAEPYSGGAGAAINLLLEDIVESIYINDANIGVFSFWNALTSQPFDFISAVENIPVTLEEWYRQRQIIMEAKDPSFSLGLATFFMSRTNRSGVIKAGPIGGSTQEAQQKAKYKIDCRFNKPDLIVRLKRIAERASQIHVSNEDALQFLTKLDDNFFVYLDPPYYTKGSSLYMNHYSHEDHKNLSEFLNNAPFKWVLSYDNVYEIRNLYQNYELFKFCLSYTVHGSKKGEELLTHSNDLVMPTNMTIRRNKSNDIAIERVM